MMHLRFLFLVLGLSLAGGACRAPRPDVASAKPQALRVGVLPDESKESLELKFRPLMDYLESSLGMPTELFIPDSYTELLELFDRREIHLAWFGGLTFVQAESASQADPLVMRDIDLGFTTDFLVRRGAAGASIEDFAGQRFSFGPRLSTSGHLMPRYFLDQRGIDPQVTFGAVVHSAGHDQTLTWVRDGEVDVGAANSVIVERLFATGRVSRDEIRVLERTPPYTNYVWAVQPSLDQAVRSSLLDAFLALDAAIPAQGAILDALGGEGFVPASRSDYKELKAAAEILGLVGSERSR